MLPTAVEDERGDLRSPKDFSLRRAAETSKPRVVWNTETRVFLTPSSTSSFLRYLSHTPCWPVEAGRVPLPAGGKGKPRDEEGLSFHGLSFLDLSYLLYPGVVKVCGAYRLQPFSEGLLAERTEQHHSQSVLESVYPR